MSVDPISRMFADMLETRVGQHGTEWLMQSASEAAGQGWAPEWFAEVAAGNTQRHRLNLADRADDPNRFSVEGGTETVDPEDNTTAWTVGRRRRPLEHDSVVTIRNDYRILLYHLIGAAETKRLIRNSRETARCGWADTWFAEVTYANCLHVFSLEAYSDRSRAWMLAYNEKYVPTYHAEASWAYGRRCRQHEIGHGRTLDNITHRLQYELAHITNVVLELQHELRYMVPAHLSVERTSRPGSPWHSGQMVDAARNTDRTGCTGVSSRHAEA